MHRVQILNYDSFIDKRTGVEFKPAEITLADGRKVIRGVATVSDEIAARYAKHPAFYVEGLDDAPSKEAKQPADANPDAKPKGEAKPKGRGKAKAEKPADAKQPDAPPADPTATADSAPSPQSPTDSASVVDSPPTEGESETTE